MTTNVVRDSSLDMTRASLDESNWACFCDDGIDALGDKRDGSADSGMAGKGNLFVGGEDVDHPAGDITLGAIWVDVVDKYSLGEVELAGDSLFLLLRRFWDIGGNGDHGERISAITGRGEDVESYKGKLHGLAG